MHSSNIVAGSVGKGFFIGIGPSTLCQVNGTIDFSDANGDVVRVDFRPVFSFTGFNFNPNVLGVRNGKISFFINCTRAGGRFSADAVLTDQAGNTSNLQRLNFICVP